MAWVKSEIRCSQALNRLGVIRNKKMIGDEPSNYSLLLKFTLNLKYNSWCF